MRPTGQQGGHLHREGADTIRGQVSGGHLLALAGLLVLPAWAVGQKTTSEVALYAAGGCGALSIVTFLAYAWDKRQARVQGFRLPEVWLHLLALLGGWPGAFVAQRRLRHKNAKLSFQFTFWLIVALHQFAAVDYLRGWPLTRLILAEAGRLVGRD